MKAQIQLPATPAIGSTIMKLALVGGVTLTCMYVILILCVSVLKIFI